MSGSCDFSIRKVLTPRGRRRHKALRGRVVVRITGGPAVGFVIANVGEAVGPQRSHRIADCVAPRHCMPLECGHDEVAAFIHPSGSGRLQDRSQAVAAHLFGNRHAGNVEDRRRNVCQADKVIHVSASRNFSRPANGKRYPCPAVVEVAFRARKRVAVVAGDDDEGIVEFARFFERL